MGQTLSVCGVVETILDPEEDLADLIGKYIGIEARDMYLEILEGYRDQLCLVREDLGEKEKEASQMEDSIDDARYEIRQLLEDLETEVDLGDLKRRIDNIYWELNY